MRAVPVHGESGQDVRRDVESEYVLYGWRAGDVFLHVEDFVRLVEWVVKRGGGKIMCKTERIEVECARATVFLFDGDFFA